jgi:hypothetical protein
MASLYLLNEADEIGSDAAEAHCARLVVTVYTAVMASSRSERGAFNAQCRPTVPRTQICLRKIARRAVARIICWKPL